MGHAAKWYLELAGQALTGMDSPGNAIFEEFFETHGLEGPERFLIQVAYGFAPDPLTPDHFLRRGNYGDPLQPKRQMDSAVERGWFVSIGEGQYKLSEKGQDVAKSLFNLIDETLGSLEPLPPADLKRIIVLLSKVVDAVKTLPDPAEKWAFSWGEKFDRGPDAPLVLTLRRRMIDLLGYRDDAHVAAWRSVEPDGQVWETLTYLWNEEAHTAAELAEKLSEYRELDEASYAAALEELAGRGWAEKVDGKYLATEKGKKLRQEAEAQTDRYYYAPWKALSKEELAELKGLFEKLVDAVKLE